MIKKYISRDIPVSEILAREDIGKSGVEEKVSAIIADVRANGDEALYRYAEKFDKVTLTSLEVTEAEILARRQVYEIYDFMKKHADGLENSFLMMTATEIGVRESRMIVGDYVLSEQECKDCAKFDDAIAACNYDIDIHNPEGTGTSHYYFKAGEYYTIPYRCLIPKTVSNMLVAGRCISSDHGAQASYRIMPVVCCIGEAAGSAIGLLARTKAPVRELNVKQLQELLKQNGAFIGV